MSKFQLFRIPPKEKTDQTQKSVSLWMFTIGYIICMGALILGIPTPSAQHPQPISTDDLPVAIPIMIAGYFLILGLLKLFDFLRKKRPY